MGLRISCGYIYKIFITPFGCYVCAGCIEEDTFNVEAKGLGLAELCIENGVIQSEVQRDKQSLKKVTLKFGVHRE